LLEGSEAPFIGQRSRARTRPAWARVRVSDRVPVATVVLEGHGLVWQCCGDEGSVVAQQGDERSSGTAGAKEVTGGDFSSSLSVVAWHELGQGMAGDVEATQGHRFAREWACRGGHASTVGNSAMYLV
jgi:hypothetical protein